MGIVNRTKDSSEQQELVGQNLRNTVTGKSDIVYRAPAPMQLQSVNVSAVGLSGAPTAQLKIERFVVGAGETFIPISAALTLVAVGTSGPQSYTLSTTALQAGDHLVVTHAGTNAAVEQLNVAVVAKALQDIKSWSFA